MFTAAGALGGTGIRAAEPVPIAQLRGLGSAELAAHPIFTIRGVVTRAKPNSCIVQDDTGALYVGLEGVADHAADATTLVPGAEVEITGRMDPGGFSPTLLATSLRRLGERPLPEPRPFDPAAFFSGADDCLVVEAIGVVQAVRDHGKTWRLTLETLKRPFIAGVSKDVITVDPRTLVDAEVRVRGPMVTTFNTRGEFLRPWITVNQPGGLVVTVPARGDPFASPRVPLAALAGFRPEPTRGHMLTTQGTVTHVVPGSFLQLQEGACGVRVFTVDDAKVVPGDRVIVAGFLDRGTPVAGLAHARVRRVERGPAPEPLPITPEEILAVNATAARSAFKAAPGDYDGCLVRFTGVLRGIRADTTGGTLIVSTAQAAVAVRLATPAFAALPKMETGSTLSVTGIVGIDWNTNPVVWPPLTPRDVTVLSRSPADIVELAAPPWWSAPRLATLAAVIATVLLTALAWAWSLRREVARQRRLVATEVRLRHEDEDRQRAVLQKKLRTSLEAAAVAHEINLPLSNVLLGSRMALDGIADLGPKADGIRPLLLGLADESRRVVTTIERMRMLLRNVQTEHTLVDLGTIVRNALVAAGPIMISHSVTVETRGLDGEHMVDGDAVQLQSAVGNLLRNAADAVAQHPPHGRRIVVELRDAPIDVCPVAAGCIDLVVGDSGPGLPAGTLDDMPLNSTKPHGTGIGLFVVRTTAENHGGLLCAGRSPFGGAELCLRLPRATA